MSGPEVTRPGSSPSRCSNRSRTPTCRRALLPTPDPHARRRARRDRGCGDGGTTGEDCKDPRWADHPSCNEDPTTATTTTPTDWDDCADLGWGHPFDLSLHASADTGEDCNDIAHQPNGTTYAFDFAVTPDTEVLGTRFVLAIRNSVPGDWCDGLWTYYDAAGNVLSSEFAGALTPREVGDGYTATLVLDEFLSGTNCTTDGEINWSDGNPDWVLTLMQGGKPLKGSRDITVTWTAQTP
jgi:hypothetical protein